MLVLSRRVDEKLIFPGINTAVQVVGIKGNVVRLGIQAPPEVVVLREEVQDRAIEWGQSLPSRDVALDSKLRKINDLLRNRLRITTKGLAVLQQQLQAGLTIDAEITLESLMDDMHLLQARVEGEVEKKATKTNKRPRRALLVEDDHNERELLASFLRMSGLDVDTAGDGGVALDYLQSSNRPDFVLLDMGMPRVDGPTAVRAIRKNPAYKGLKIFAVSGHSPDEYNLGTGPLGIDRWFSKPLDPAALVRDLNQELESSLTGI